MSFVDGGDLASIAAIAAESSLANKEGAESHEEELTEKTDAPQEHDPVSMAQDDTSTSMAQDDGHVTMAQDEAPTSMVQEEAHVTMAQDEAHVTMVQDEAHVTMAQHEAPVNMAQDETPASMAQEDIPVTMIEGHTPVSMVQDHDTPVSMALQHMTDTEDKSQQLEHLTQPSEHTEEAALEESESKNEIPTSTEETEHMSHTVQTSEVGHEVATSDASDAHLQSTYANLQPIFLAMEMGQDAAQTHQTGEQEVEPSSTASIMAQTSQMLQVSQAGAADSQNANQLVFSQQVQGASMLLNSLAASTADGGTSLQSILQDVVSGMQTSTGTVPAAIITDPSSSTGSYLIVNQNGIPIVRPVLVSNMPHDSSGAGHQELHVLSHGMEDGGTGDGGQETVTVEVGANTDTGSSGGGMVEVEPSMDLRTVMHHHDGSGDEDSAPSRNVVGGKRKLSDGPRICEECNKAFKYPSDLKKHLQIHTNVKKFKCEDCGRLFRRLHQLNVHTRIHTGEKPYVCNRCGISFRHDSTLTMHIRTRHDHLRPFKCEDCGNTFGRLSHLRKHVRKVCGNRRNKDRPIAQCRFCDENFPTKGDLRKHVLTCEKKEQKVKAKEVTLHVCDQCSKDFASPYNLRRHQLTHTDEKPFQCDVCARQFKEKSSLSKHIKRKHTGVDQGSQTEETGETEFHNVDVIAESSGVPMDPDDDEVEDLGAEETSTVDASSLLPSDAVHIPNHEVRVQGTQVIQGDIEMTTIELSLPPGSESHEATALQAAVEALVSASQQQIAVEQESMEVTTEESTSGKEIFEGVEAQGVVASEVEYAVQEEAKTELTDASLVTGDTQEEYVGATGEPAAQEQVPAQ